MISFRILERGWSAPMTSTETRLHSGEGIVAFEMVGDLFVNLLIWTERLEKISFSKSQFMHDPNMWSEAPYWWCDARVGPLEACRGHIVLHTASLCSVCTSQNVKQCWKISGICVGRRALYSSKCTWLVDVSWGREVLYKQTHFFDNLFYNCSVWQGTIYECPDFCRGHITINAACQCRCWIDHSAPLKIVDLPITTGLECGPQLSITHLGIYS